IEVGRSPRDLAARVAPSGTSVAVTGDPRARLVEEQGSHVLRVPATATPLTVKLFLADGDGDTLRRHAAAAPPPGPLAPLTRGGPPRWATTLTTRPEIGPEGGPFAVDVLTPPEVNPWSCQVRFGGLDFFPGGRRAAVCSWDGDVWLVDGVDDLAGPLTWRR